MKRCAVREDSKVVEELAGLETGIEEVLRQGARGKAFGPTGSGSRTGGGTRRAEHGTDTVDGRRAVVRNGYQPEREILTRALGPIPIPLQPALFGSRAPAASAQCVHGSYTRPAVG